MDVSRLGTFVVAALFPFVSPWDDASHTLVSLNYLAHVPAGAYGHVYARNGHLYAGEERIRFVGMNFTFSAALPASRRDADAVAGRLAKYGVNAVRLMSLDIRPAPEGLLAPDRATLDERALARFDWFVYRLQQHGIYVALPLYVGRRLPGVARDDERLPPHDGLDLFDTDAIRVQQAYARAVLEHRNPHTGLRYAEDPGVAFVEIVNENGLLINWWRGRFVAWPASAQARLEQEWNEWLRRRYGDDDRLRGSWGTGLQSKRNVVRPRWNEWRLEQSAGGRAAVDIRSEGDGTIARVRVSSPGAAPHSVRWLYHGLAFAEDSGLQVAFDARVDRDCTITGAVEQSVPYKLLDRKTVRLTGGEWKHYELVFTPLASTTGSRLTLSDLSACQEGIEVRNVELAIGGATGLRPGDSLGRVEAIARSDFDNRTAGVQRDWLRFLTELEGAFYVEMRRFLRQELGVKSLLVGTQQNYSPPPALRDMDVVDMHGYWDTQRQVGPALYQMLNQSQVGDPQGGIVGAIAPYRLTGKPFIVTEYNYRGANTYAAEADMLMLAYASLHDWDGVFIFNYANNDLFAVDRMIGDEGFNGHSNRFASLLPAALMFRRGDLQPSRDPVIVCVTESELFDHMRKHGASTGAVHFGMPVDTSLRHGVSLEIVPSKCKNRARTVGTSDKRRVHSDTGEIIWTASREGPGSLVIDSPKTKAVIGPVREFRSGGVQIKVGATVQDWAATILTALDSRGGSRGRWLLVATGMSRNTNMTFFDAARTRYQWGTGPVLVEGVPLTLRLPAAAEDVRAFALDETGLIRDDVPVQGDARHAEIGVGSEHRTIWYLIEMGGDFGGAPGFKY